MLIGATVAALYFMIFGGGDGDPASRVFDRIDGRIGEHVKEKARRKAAEAVLEEMRATREGVLGKVEELAERLSAAHAAHATPRAETEEILDELEAVRRDAWTKQVDARFKLRETLSREEWGKIFPPPGQ
jgi:hypothetical protein